MGWLTSILGGAWGYVAAAALSAVLAVPATVYVTALPYKATIARMEASQANQKAADVSAALTKLQTFIANMNAASAQYGDQQAALFAKLDALNRTFRNATKANPLPPDCRPDAVRVRALSESVTATNAAATGSGFGETVRSDHRPGGGGL